MVKILSLGNIDPVPLEQEFGKLQTSKIIITGERIAHIRERHPIDYGLFEQYGKQCVQKSGLYYKRLQK